MSALEITLTIALGITFGLALIFGLRLQTAKADAAERDRLWQEKEDDAEARARDLYESVYAITADPVRYEILLADWGPDFTGIDGVLPRWRWSVVDADRDLKAALGGPVEIGSTETPFMLGNSISPEAAVLAAVQWCEREQHPPVFVIAGESL